MRDIRKVCSLTDFQKRTTKHLQRLRRTGKPEVLTLNGKADMVIQSAKGYQELLQKADLGESVRILSRRLGDSQEGDIPARKVLREVRRRLGLGAHR